MTNVSTNAGSAEVTPIDTLARGPLLLLVGSAVAWLVVSGILALITSIQLHTPQFLAEFSWLTYGRTQALRETAFIYGWAANAGVAVGTWVLGRLGGYPLRALNWAVVGSLFWNLGVTAGLVGIATGDMSGFALLQLPRYVQPLLAFSFAAMAIAGVLAWTGRRTDRTFAAQWYAVAALFLFPWLLCAAQAVLVWMPVRGTVQAIAANWYGQGIWTLWLAPLALAGAYYVVPKVAGRVLPTYESAPLGFWVLIFVGSWTGGRSLIGGPVPAWIPTIAVVASALLLFHYFVIGLNFRLALRGGGNAMKFIRVGLIAYLLAGAIEFITSFRGVAVETQFTFSTTAVEQLGLYGGISMLLFGAIYYMVPRLTGAVWASAALTTGHRVGVLIGLTLSILALFAAGFTQASGLMNAKASFAEIFNSVRVSLLLNTAAQLVLLIANSLLLVNFFRTITSCAKDTASVPTLFRQPVKVEAHAS